MYITQSIIAQNISNIIDKKERELLRVNQSSLGVG